MLFADHIKKTIHQRGLQRTQNFCGTVAIGLGQVKERPFRAAKAIPKFNCHLERAEGAIATEASRKTAALFPPEVRLQGVLTKSSHEDLETTWADYERFRETRNLFLLYQSTDVTGILPKRAFTNPTDLEWARVLIGSKVRSA